jgi:23S rRNA (adenine2503-C2)-methyltransferase
MTSTAASGFAAEPAAPACVTACLRSELEQHFAQRGWSAFRARQVWQWLYHKQVDRYNAMTDLPRAAQAALAHALPLVRSQVHALHCSHDGSEKRVLTLADGETVETVWLPMGTHATVCVSTQVGCPIGCTFCASGADGLLRNLTTDEIVEQVWHACAAHPRNEINNLVFMGMGEPLLNWANLVRAIRILNDPHGLCIGARRMTISTVGVVRGIAAVARETPQCNLAVSLHATTDALRRTLIPRCPSTIAALLHALADYAAMTRRRIIFEYVLLRGINDTLRDAQRLVALIRHLPCKVNVIPYNAIPGGGFTAPLPQNVHNFVEYLCSHRVTAIARRRKGDDIAAACGQLRRAMAAS